EQGTGPDVTRLHVPTAPASFVPRVSAAIRQLTLLILLLVLSASGCATQSPWSRYEMCFGLSADAGRTRISDQQWQQFRDEEIVKRFPDGFTVYPANGYWRSGVKTYSEPSRVLMVVAPETEETEKKLKAIAEAYARRFRQKAVLQMKSAVKVYFHAPNGK
ncbi:MAG: DUF3574 domain-containing protein, partial [Deltaproteobacteria bacterium]|nr:DUF3574 domain-containing protein [Deltaproteobacteria bacterium]